MALRVTPGSQDCCDGLEPEFSACGWGSVSRLIDRIPSYHVLPARGRFLAVVVQAFAQAAGCGPVLAPSVEGLRVPGEGATNVVEVHMSRLTVFLARSLGLFMILLVAGLLARGGAGIEAGVSDGPVLLSYAIISLAMGVAMVVGHNVWSAGILPLVVTLVGWLVLVKGLWLLIISPASLLAAMHQMHYAEHYPVFLAPAFVVGLYLTWAGFAAKPTS